MTAVHAYAWDWFDADGNGGLLTVFPTGGGVSKTVQVFAAAATGQTAAQYANTIADRADVFAANGQRVALRLFQELWVPGEDRFLWYDETGAPNYSNPENWWFSAEPFVVPPIPTVTQDYWNAFGAAWRGRSVSAQLAYLVGEEEQELGFDGIRGIANRTAFFAPITSDTESPYFGLSNIGSPASDPLAAQFRLEYNAWGYAEKASILRTMHGPIFSASPVAAGSGLPWTNFKDRPEGTITGRFAPEVYAYTTLVTTDKAAANLNRWQDIIEDFNAVRAYAADGSEGEIDPWVAPPGFGVSTAVGAGGSDWCVPASLPAETILWRAVMEHLHATGVGIHIVWNPSIDPNRAANCATLDAYYAQGHEVTGLVRDLPAIAPDATAFTTTGNGRSFTVSHDNLFNLAAIYYRRADAVMPVPYLHGWPWSDTDPLLISPGEAGDAELADLLAAYALVQDDAPEALESPSPATQSRATIGPRRRRARARYNRR